MSTKKKFNAAYFGIDNVEEVEVVFTPKMRKEIERVAKRYKVPVVELLARHFANISIAGLSGTAVAMQQSK